MSEKKEAQSPVFCSFCGRHSDFVKKLVAGVEHNGKIAYICNSCAELACEIVKDGESID